jgi:lysozyme
MMDKRQAILCILASCVISILSTCFAAHYGWFREHKPVVSSSTWYGVSKHVGLQETYWPDYTISDQRLNWEDDTKTWDNNTMNLIKILAFEEGFSNKPYLCELGYVTIGLGTKLHKSKGMNPNDFPIRVSLRMAEEWLHAEVEMKHERLSSMTSNKYAFIYNHLTEDRKAIIMSMAYQMGVGGVQNFKKMWLALAVDDFDKAAVEALDSLWAKQTENRAERHALVLGGKSLVQVYGEGY